MSVFARFSVAAIALYQRRWAARIDRQCLLWPSCSEYTVLAIQRHGAIHGWRMGLRRVAECIPNGPRPAVDLP